MNEFQIKSMKDCAEFLYNNNMSRNFLWELLQESFKNKEHLNDLLGLDEKEDYRIIIPTDDAARDDITEFVEQICRIKTILTKEKWTMVDKTFIQDSRKNKFKITRILDKSLWREIVQTPAGMVLAKRSMLLNCCADCTFDNPEYAKEFITKFAIWYGERVKSGCNIVLSSNPVDMLMASHNASFKSCYSPSGSVFNGTISSMLSSDTLIAWVEEYERPGYKVGRSWVYCNSDLIICARKYGGITDNHHLHLRNYIYKRMGGDWVHRPTWNISPDIVEMNGPGYIDNGTGDVMTRKEVTSSSKAKKIIIPKATCLYCGNKHNNNSSLGVCKTCIETVSHSLYLE